MTLYDTIFEQLEEGSYDGIVIPVQSVKLITGSARAFHKYLGRAGHDVEPLGRDAISGVMSATYTNDLEDVGATNDLWPGTLQLLRERAQDQKPGPLVVPTLGRIPYAYIDLDEDYTPDLVDGAKVLIKFVEDSGELFSGLSIKSPRSKATMAAVDADLALDTRAADALRAVPSDDGSPFTSFTSAVYNLLGQLDVAMDDFARPIRQIAGMVQAINATLDTARYLTTPENWPAAAALRELKSQLISLEKQITHDDDLASFACVVATNANAVAIATGNTVSELLGLNSLEDANDIEAGTTLLYFKRK